MWGRERFSITKSVSGPATLKGAYILYRVGLKDGEQGLVDLDLGHSITRLCLGRWEFG